jgi:hypothetical protein
MEANPFSEMLLSFNRGRRRVSKISVTITACLYGVSSTCLLSSANGTEERQKINLCQETFIELYSPYVEINSFYPEKNNYEVVVNLRSTNFKSIYIYIYIYLFIFLTAIALTPGGSSTVHIYTQTIHRTTQSTQTIHRTTQSTQTTHKTTQLTNWEECGLCPVFASYALALVLQLRKKVNEVKT